MDARQKAIGIITGSRVDALEKAGLVVVERGENERLRELLEKECERCACCLLRQRDSLRVRCEKLEGVVKNLLHEIDEGIPCRENGDGIYIGNAIDPECDAVKEAKDALAEGGSG